MLQSFQTKNTNRMAQNQDNLGGVIVPMVTPVNKNGMVDQLHAKKLINFLLDNGTIPFIMGTTGEATSLSIDERDVFVKILVENQRQNRPLIVGVIGLSYNETIKEANKYLSWGIDAVVITLANYYQLTDEQMFSYFLGLSENINGNIIIYNIPKTIHMSIPLEVVDRLSRVKNIIGIKDSEMNEERLEKSLKLWKERTDFKHFVGVNSLMAKGLQLGTDGLVPSTGNLQPDLYTKLFELGKEGNMNDAVFIQEESNKLSKIYQEGKTLGESIAALKVILFEMNLCQPWMLSPLTQLSDIEANDILVKFKTYSSKKQ